MKYFNNLPLIVRTDNNNNSIVVNNLLTRSYILPSLLKNIILFYDYDVREGDTPENIAYRYYNDVYRYWLILYSNNIIDPQSEWPLNYNDFQRYVIDKYRNDTANSLIIAANAVTSSQTMSFITSSPHHFEKIINTTDTTNYQNHVITTHIDINTYNSMMDKETMSRTFDNGVVATVTITKKAVSIYEYEERINENKRKIQILNSDYAVDKERQIIKLMKGVYIT